MRVVAGAQFPRRFWANSVLNRVDQKSRRSHFSFEVVAAPMASQQFCFILAMMGSRASSMAVAWYIWLSLSYSLLYLICIKLWIVGCEYFASWNFNWKFLKTLCIWAGLTIVCWFIWEGLFFLEATGGLASLASSLVILLVFVLFVCDGAARLSELCQRHRYHRS